MGNLIKYEFRKTMALKGIILVITAIFEAMFLIGIGADNDDMIGLSVLLLCIIAICGIFITGVFGVYTLSKDLNTKRSYMLFMTPHSSYSILGAKLIENATSIFLCGFFFILIELIDITSLLSHYGELEDLLSFIREYFGYAYIDASDWILAGVESLIVWTFIIVVGFFSVVLSSSVLTGRKFNGLISLILFIFIIIYSIKIYLALDEVISFSDLFCFFYFVMLSCIMYVISAWIMDNKLSV